MPKPESTRLIELHIRLPEEDAEALKRLAAGVGATPSGYARALIHSALIAERKGKVIV